MKNLKKSKAVIGLGTDFYPATFALATLVSILRSEEFVREALNNSSFPRTRESMLLIFRDTRVRGYDIFRVIQSFLRNLAE